MFVRIERTSRVGHLRGYRENDHEIPDCVVDRQGLDKVLASITFRYGFFGWGCGIFAFAKCAETRRFLRTRVRG